VRSATVAPALARPEPQDRIAEEVQSDAALIDVAGRFPIRRTARSAHALSCARAYLLPRKPEVPPLVVPIQRQPGVVHEPAGRQVGRLLAVQDCAQNIRRQQREPEESPGVRRGHAFRFCDLIERQAFVPGYYDEARYWRDWLLRAAAGSPSQIQTMYGLAGEKRLAEWEVPWLSGYEGSKPVRIGNAASDQLQIDVFGEVMDALHLARVGGLQDIAEGWDFQRALLSHLEKVWSFMDDGIWEVRGERQHFTHSKVMAWVAFDRAIKSAEAFRLMGPIDRWRDVRAEIHREVCERAFNRGIGAFVQAFGSDRLDASTLLIPAVGFLPPDDARVQGTIARQSSAGSCPMGSCCGTIP
jgi:hypothetical protein